MNQQNGPYNDLNIYEKGLSEETERSFDDIKSLFNVFLVIQCTFIVPFCILSFLSGSMPHIIMSVFSMLAIFYLIAYVHYPKSEPAGSCLCSLILSIYVALNVIGYVMLCIVLVMSFFSYVSDLRIKDFRHIVMAILMFTIGFLLLN